MAAAAAAAGLPLALGDLLIPFLGLFRRGGVLATGGGLYTRVGPALAAEFFAVSFAAFFAWAALFAFALPSFDVAFALVVFPCSFAARAFSLFAVINEFWRTVPLDRVFRGIVVVVVCVVFVVVRFAGVFSLRLRSLRLRGEFELQKSKT